MTLYRPPIQTLTPISILPTADIAVLRQREHWASESVANGPHGSRGTFPACAAVAYLLNHAIYATDRPHVKAWTGQGIADLAGIWQGLDTVIPGLSLADCCRCVRAACSSDPAGDLPFGYIDPGEALEEVGMTGWERTVPVFRSLPGIGPLVKASLALGWPVAAGIVEQPGICSWVEGYFASVQDGDEREAVREGNVVVILGWNDDTLKYAVRRMDLPSDDPKGWETIDYSLFLDPRNVKELVVLESVNLPKE